MFAFVSLTMQTKRSIEPEKLKRVAYVLKTIAHHVRLEILEILEAEEPLSVSTILERLDADVEQSMLSHHLIKMRDNGILESTKEGKHVLYQISDRDVLKIFDCMESCDFI